VKIYSDVPAQRFGQFFGDVMLVCWAVVCASLGLLVYKVTNALGAPGRKAAEAGDSLAGGLRDLADPASQVTGSPRPAGTRRTRSSSWPSCSAW